MPLKKSSKSESKITRRRRRRREDDIDSEEDPEEQNVLGVEEALHRLQELPTALFAVLCQQEELSLQEQRERPDCSVQSILCRGVCVWSKEKGIDLISSKGYPNVYDVISGACVPARETPVEEAEVRPTHFLNVRIDGPQILASVKELQEHIVRLEPRYAPGLVTSDHLHVTLCSLGLDTPQQVRDALALLTDSAALIQRFTRPAVLVFDELDTFRGRVLHAKVKVTPELADFSVALRNMFTEGGMCVRERYGFNPHMTLLKVAPQLGVALRTNLLDPCVFERYRKSELGSQALHVLHLCARRADNTGYQALHTLPLEMHHS